MIASKPFGALTCLPRSGRRKEPESGVRLVVVALVHDGFLHAAHHPCVNPFSSCPNRAVTVTDSDVPQPKTTDPANRRHVGARVVRGLPGVQPPGAREGVGSLDHYER